MDPTREQRLERLVFWSVLDLRLCNVPILLTHTEDFIFENPNIVDDAFKISSIY